MNIKLRLLLSMVTMVAIESVLVDCQCYNITKQYFECNQLQMIPGRDGVYIADPNIPGNVLTEDLIKSEKLLNKTFEQSLAFFKSIYDLANPSGRRAGATKCDTVCKCVKSYTSRIPLFSFYFGSRRTMAGAQTILTNYMSANKPLLLAESDIIQRFYYWGNQTLLTLSSFCARNNFDYQRASFYYFSSNPPTYPSDSETFVWYFEYVLTDGIVQADDSRTTYETKLVSAILAKKNLFKDDLRFEALSFWANNVSELTWTGPSLITYLDGWIKKVQTAETKTRFVRASIARGSLWNTTIITRLNQQISSLRAFSNWTNATDFVDTCFKTTNLRIDCTWSFRSNQTLFGLSQLNYTFLFPNYPVGKQSFIYIINQNSPNWNLEKYVYGPLGEILIYYRGNDKGIMMYEFSTKTYSYVWGWSSPGFDLYVPTILVNGADGILATGNFSVPWIRSV